MTKTLASRFEILAIQVALVFFFATSASAQQRSGCLGHHPKYIEGTLEVEYAPGCTGHDEPELDPVSTAAGSASDLTWSFVLPTGGARPVSAVGPTFWFGGTVTDPKSLFGQAFVELQFYLDSIVGRCASNGGFAVNFAPNTFSACSPVWKITQKGSKKIVETAAFNAMLVDSAGPNQPLLMHAGETITVHYFVTPQKDGFHITVTDLDTGHSGTIVLNSPTDGPLMPVFDTQTIGNALAWGNVFDTPNAFVWEIGHESDFTGRGQLCQPDQVGCDSYDPQSWLDFSPIQIKSVTFGDGSTAREWAVVSDQGGKAEVNLSCSVYGGPFCIYPWYALGTSGFHYGVDYPDNLEDFGKANQFAQTQQCGGPLGPNSTYCATVIINEKKK